MNRSILLIDNKKTYITILLFPEFHLKFKTTVFQVKEVIQENTKLFIEKKTINRVKWISTTDWIRRNRIIRHIFERLYYVLS